MRSSLSNREGRIVMTNPQAERMFGYVQQELIGQPVEILMPDRFRKGHMDHRSAYSQKPVARPMGKGLELTAVRKDGIEVPVEISLTPIETANGTVVASTIRDITERKHLAQQTRRAAVLDERSRMARDVHDTVAQAFTGIVLNLEAAEEEAQDLSEEVRRRIERARDVARQSLEEVRRSILALSSALPVHGDSGQFNSRIRGPLLVEHKDPRGIFRPRNAAALGLGHRGKPAAHCSASDGQCPAACSRQLHPHRARF